MTTVDTMRAERIAKAGAAKMTAQGYTFNLFPMSRVAGHVVKADGTRYAVNTFTGKCACPFHKENGICKHQVWLRDELAREEADRARWETEAADFAEYATFGRYL